MRTGDASRRSADVSTHAYLSGCVTDTPSDMANIDVDWEVEGIIQADESVSKMLGVIQSKGKDDTGTFWCWDGRVRIPCHRCSSCRISCADH